MIQEEYTKEWEFKDSLTFEKKNESLRINKGSNGKGEEKYVDFHQSEEESQTSTFIVKEERIESEKQSSPKT